MLWIDSSYFFANKTYLNEKKESVRQEMNRGRIFFLKKRVLYLCCITCINPSFPLFLQALSLSLFGSDCIWCFIISTVNRKSTLYAYSLLSTIYSLDIGVVATRSNTGLNRVQWHSFYIYQDNATKVYCLVLLWQNC